MSSGPAQDVALVVVMRAATDAPSAACCSTRTWAASVCASLVIAWVSLSFVAAMECSGLPGMLRYVWSPSTMWSAIVRKASFADLEATSYPALPNA